MIRKTDRLPIRRQCQLLGLNRSSLYYKHVVPDPVKQERQERVMQRIDWWHTNYPYLGSRKLAKKLCNENLPGYAQGRPSPDESNGYTGYLS